MSDNPFDDSSATPSGAQADTYYDGNDSRPNPTDEMLDVERKFKEDDVDKNEALTILDRIASQLKS